MLTLQATKCDTKRYFRETKTLVIRQTNFDLLDECPRTNSLQVDVATELLANSGGLVERGAIFTRSEVVGFILDLAGYTDDRHLHKMRLLEPSFGEGDFLLPIISRLLAAWRAAGEPRSALDALGDAIFAVELHRKTFLSTREKVIALLKSEGLADKTSRALADHWLTQGDFLLVTLKGRFDFVAGNPPYVRQEMIPAPLLSEYRNRYTTMYDRADIYVPSKTRLRISPSSRISKVRRTLSATTCCVRSWCKSSFTPRRPSSPRRERPPKPAIIPSFLR